MLILKQQNSRGDTLIEVLFAISVFSLVAVGALSIMNQGANTSQRALEITLVRQEIDAQAETLRFLNASYVAAFGSDYASNSLAAQWSKIQSSALKDEASSFGTGSACPKSSSDLRKSSFILNPTTATVVPLVTGKFVASSTFSQIEYANDNSVSSADGLWIEAVRPDITKDNDQGSADYIDFNIRACWDSPGQSTPVTLGTIVRLYEPR
jgi:prepilin-type N-terminal cleavage/methylation domain-containing protein